MPKNQDQNQPGSRGSSTTQDKSGQPGTQPGQRHERDEQGQFAGSKPNTGRSDMRQNQDEADDEESRSHQRPSDNRNSSDSNIPGGQRPR